MIFFFALIGQKNKNMSVYSYEKQSAQPGNIEITMHAGILSQATIQVNFSKIYRWIITDQVKNYAP